MIVIA